MARLEDGAVRVRGHDGPVVRAQVITEADLEANENLQRQLIAVRQQEYEITRQHLEQMIFEQLLDQAAEEINRARGE